MNSERLGTLLVRSTASMRETVQAIDRNASGIVFVVDEAGRLQGVATDGDVRRAILRGLPLHAPVSEFMTRDPVKGTVGMPMAAILDLMSERVKYVPIVDETGRVVDYAALTHIARLPVASPLLEGNELRYVAECVVTNWISSQGRFVAEFEHAFARFCAVKHCVATSNGTVALHLALLLAGVGPGDEVIVPTLTFIATANAVRHAGATAVFVDSDPSTWTLDPRQIERKITRRTKAVIPVHLYGHPADMDPILEMTRRNHLFVIEDAAQAHGAAYKGRPVGSMGNIGCFSFFANKIVTTGEGGMLTTDDDEFDDRARLLRDHGMSRTQKYHHDMVGYNYRLTNLQAAVGVAQMERVDRMLKQRAQIAAWYRELLRDHDRIELPTAAPWAQPVTWLFTILLKGGVDRDTVIERLKDRGIESRPVFYPIHSMPAYNIREDFPVAESISRRGLTLPTSVTMGQAEIARICDALKECI